MELFKYSEPIDPSKARELGCFTTLPIRIHRSQDIADAASHRLIRDWAKYIGDGRERGSHASLSKHGNLCALIYLESLPERLGVATYLTDLGLLHDGVSFLKQAAEPGYADKEKTLPRKWA
jgi:ophiobolin F synthase